MAAEQTIEELRGVLMEAGIPIGMFGDLLDQAVTEGWSGNQLTMNIYASDEFQAMFPGIFRPDGTMRMTAGQYRNLADQYQSNARMYGISNLSNAQIGKLIGGDVSVQEFTDRATAIQRVTEFKPAFEEFKQVLASRGIDTKGLDSDKDIVNFMLGKGPKQFYQLWDELSVGTAARMSGVHINQKLVKSIAKRMPGQADEAQLQSQFADLAAKMKTVMPLSKLGKYGITKRDLVTLEFGGKKQAEIADKVNRILANRGSFNDSQNKAHVATSDFGTVQQERAQGF